MVFNTAIPRDCELFNIEFEKLRGKTVELKEVSNARSVRQNRALHLLFDKIAVALNELGITHIYHGLNKKELETHWTGGLFKEVTWKPLQMHLYQTDSTTKLTSKQIDEMFQVLNKFFAERGVQIEFPTEIL